MRCPGKVEEPTKIKVRRTRWIWTPPSTSSIKVNVDGFFRARSRSVRIRGVFRDANGRVVLQFPKEVEVDLARHVELLALYVGLLMAVASRWASSHVFIFKSLKTNCRLGGESTDDSLAIPECHVGMLLCFWGWD